MDEQDNSELFSISWNNHSDHLVSSFEDLFKSNCFTDVTLYCKGKLLHTHKVLLSACSGYFRELFKELVNMKNIYLYCPLIIPLDIQPDVMANIIRFMYSGELQIQASELETFLLAAEFLQIYGLGIDTDDCNPSIKDESRNNNRERDSSSLSPPELRSRNLSKENLHRRKRSWSRESDETDLNSDNNEDEQTTHKRSRDTEESVYKKRQESKENTFKKSKTNKDTLSRSSKDNEESNESRESDDESEKVRNINKNRQRKSDGKSSVDTRDDASEGVKTLNKSKSGEKEKQNTTETQEDSNARSEENSRIERESALNISIIQDMLNDDLCLNSEANPNFECPVCAKQHSSSTHLKRHILIHTGDTMCMFCSKTYSRIDNLTKHIQYAHKNQSDKKTQNQ